MLILFPPIKITRPFESRLVANVPEGKFVVITSADPDHDPDNGKLYAVYANQIWNKLVEDPHAYVYTGSETLKEDGDGVMEFLFEVFHRMENDILQNLSVKANGKLNALAFQAKRAERIGIVNIRNSRLKRIEEEKQLWLDSMRKNQSVVPDVKNILRVRIDG